MTDSSELSEFERKQIIGAMDHVLSTDKFLAAPQMSAFFRYVVEQSVSGNQNRIKAYTVAVDALGKPETFDPQNDPVVRVLAGRLRSSLGGYYITHPNTNVVIKMKPGSYVPAFVNQQKKYQSNNTSADAEQTSADPGTLAVISDAGQGNATSTLDIKSPENTEKGHTHEVTSSEKVQSALRHTETTNAASQLVTPNQSGWFQLLLGGLRNTPKTAIAAGLITLALFTTYQNRSAPDEEPRMKAATPINSALNTQHSDRARPDHLSIFVSAVDEGNSLENQLNSMMSGVFSESGHVRVYRILESHSNDHFWPEDYTLSLEVLTLPTETRIGIQLMSAQTGRIIHTDTIVLSSSAMQRLTHEELEHITVFSRNLVSERGPLVIDYQTAEISNSIGE